MLEKVDTMKKPNQLVEILSNKKVKYIVGTILLSVIGIALPRVFHVLAGEGAGAIFLPMHIAVLIAAMVFGVLSGSVVAGISIIASFLLTGMPTLARLPYMLIELLIYAVLLGLFSKKYNTFISLIATLVLGKLIYAGILFAAIHIGLPTYGISVLESVYIGIPGLIIQLFFVPIIAKFIKKGLHKND